MTTLFLIFFLIFLDINGTNINKQDIYNLKKTLYTIFEDKELNNKKIYINSGNCSIHDIIELIGISANINFTIDDNVKGNIGKIFFKNATAGHILRSIFNNSNQKLALVKDIDCYRITTYSKAEEYLIHKIIGDIVCKSFNINNINLTEKFAILIEKTWNNIVTEKYKTESNIFIDIDRKKIFVKSYEKFIEQFKIFLTEIDTAILQIRIDAIIVFVQKNYNFDFGINWSGIYNRLNSIKLNKKSFSFVGIGGRLNDFPIPTQSQFPNNQNLLINPDNFALNLFTKIFRTQNSSDSNSITESTVKIPFIFGGPDLNLKRLNLLLNAAEMESKVKIISRPSVVTNDNEIAKILIGESIPIQTSRIGDILNTGAAVDLTSLSYKDIGIFLEVHPIISPNKKNIKLSIAIEESEIVGGSTQTNEKGVMTNPPVIDILKIQNKVTLKNGQTVIIGGLSTRDERKGTSKVPFLHKIPIIGRLFVGTSEIKREFDQFIFITPTIIES